MFLIKDVPVGRLNALVKKLGGLEVMYGILNDTVKFTVESVASTKNFFQTRSYLRVTENFKRFVLDSVKRDAEPVETNHFDLPRIMTDTMIEERLQDDFDSYIWDEGVLCATLQKWFTELENGGVGVPLNIGHPNLFYTNTCVVDVVWHVDGRQSCVRTWLRGEVSSWQPDVRVFYPAT